MLFEDYYSSPFKTNSRKEQASFFTSVIYGNENSTENPLKHSKTCQNGHCKIGEGKLEISGDTTKTKIEAFSYQLSGLTGVEKETWRDVQPRSVSVTSPVAVSLDELASAHLQRLELSRRSTASDQPLFSEPMVSGFASPKKASTTGSQDDFDKIDDSDVEVKKVCDDTIIIGVKNLSLREKSPSSFGRVLCRKVGQCRNTHVLFDIQNGFQSTSPINPFDFTTPSPDDIVRCNQKLRK